MAASSRAGLLTGMLVLGVSLVGATGVPGTFAAATHHAAITATKKVQAKESHDKYLFSPARITVKKGTKVVWTNTSDAEHNVTITKGMKVNKDFEEHKSVNVTFMKAGTYQYHCEYHPYMTGTVTVKP